MNEYKLGAVVFAVVGIFLFYIFFIGGHSNNQDDISFTVKPNRPMPDFLCKANTYYEINTEHGISKLKVNNNFYDVPDFKRYVIIFDKDTYLGINPFTDGVWFKSSELNIKKLSSEPSAHQGIFIFITPEKYSDYFIPVKKGMIFNLVKQNDLYYFGEFSNNQLVADTLIKREEFSTRFTNNRIIRFKAAEVPFFLFINNKPYIEKLLVNGKVIGDALHLIPGDIIKTDIWVDKGDHVIFDKQYNSFGVWLTDRLLFSSGSSDWHELSGYCDKYFDVQDNGYLSIKCLQQTTIDFMKIIRRTKELNLAANESVKFPVFPGDEYEITSSSRFYFNGQLFNANVNYKYTTFNDTPLEFKASVDPKPILIKTTQRKGI